MADDYQTIVDNLFLKRYCLKSKKRNCGWNGVDVGVGAAESLDPYPLPDPELYFVPSYSSGPSEKTSQDCFSGVGSSGDGNVGDVELDMSGVWKELSSLKETLNETRNKLSDKDMDQWHDHTKGTNPAGSVVGEVRRLFNPELCTQAWCKFYEILVTFPSLVRCRGRFRSLHLCEAPGAFVAALNYYLNAKKLWIKDWEWRANSLNPYYEGNPYECMIGDDRLIFHTAKRWIFGAEDTGDLTSSTTLDSLMQSGGEFDLVTADGSIDCQEDPNEQEQHLLGLHFCEVVCALLTLSKGGHFVLKRFTMFERSSVALLYLVCCAFEEVNFFKPATSKSGNAELYIICESYKGLPEAYLSKLRGYYDRYSSAVVCQHPVVPSNEIPRSFLQVVYSAQKFFIDHQLTMMRFNIATFRSWTPELQEKCTAARLLVVNRFLATVGLAAEAKCESRMIVPFLSGSDENGPCWLKIMPWQKRYGTFDQRNSDHVERPRYVLQNLVDELGVFQDRLSIGGGVEFRTFIITGYSSSLSSTEWYKDNQPEPVYGRRLSVIKNSKLCHGGLLILYRNLRDMFESSGAGEPNKDTYQLEPLELCQFAKHIPADALQPGLSTVNKDQDCVWIDLTTSIMSKVAWLDFLIGLLSSDKPPQSVELTRSRLLILTRFTANVLIVLCSCYEQVTLVARNNPAGMCTIKAENYRGLPASYASNLASYLRRVRYGFVKRERTADPTLVDMDLLQFLPMHYLSDLAFHKKVQRFNGTVLLRICQELLFAVTGKKKNEL